MIHGIKTAKTSDTLAYENQTRMHIICNNLLRIAENREFGERVKMEVGDLEELIKIMFTGDMRPL